jgi:hypothetical protein
LIVVDESDDDQYWERLVYVMAGTRVRCVCGTVFDPSELAACPACATVYSGKRVESSSNEVVTNSSATVSTSLGDDSNRRDGAAGFGGGEPSFFEKNKTLVTVGGCVGGFLMLALVVRLFFGGGDAPMGSDPKATRVDPVVLVPEGEDGERSVPSEQFPSSEDSPPPSPTVAPRRSENPGFVPPAAPSDIPSFRGTWRLATTRMQPEPNIPGLRATESVIGQAVTAAFIGPSATAIMTIDDTGAYRIDVDVSGDGQYTANLTGAENLYSVSAQGMLTLSPKGALNSDRARALLKPVRMDMAQVNAKEGDTLLTLSPGERGGTTNVTLVRSADSFQPETTVVGDWRYYPIFVDSFISYQMTLELRDNGDYHIRFVRSEDGTLTAAGGDYEFKRSIRMGPQLKGRYEFEGANRFTLSEPRGTATWVRDDGSGAGKPSGGRRTRR